MAQTAVVLSTHEASGTTVVGVLSNEPYEERGDAPIGLNCSSTDIPCIITLWTKDKKPCLDKGTHAPPPPPPPIHVLVTCRSSMVNL